MKQSEKRRDIMEAALELIAERGFHGAPIAEIAGRAGVAAGTIYRYFESKDILINELNRELEETIIRVLSKGYPEGKTVQERFLYMARELFRYFIAHPLHFRFMEQYSYSPYGISRRRDRLTGTYENHDQDMVRKTFEEGIRDTVLKDFPVVVLFGLAFGPLASLVRDHTLGFIDLDETLIDHITEACWDAIKR